MTTFLLPLNKVNAAVLDSLVTNGVGEGRQLEYKETLQVGRDAEKSEFLRDVSSFANGAGGDLFFGIKERRESDGRQTGAAGEIVGLPNLNLDETKQKLENLLRDGLDPRLTSVEFHPIPRPGGAPCLLLRISRSWSGPHMVTFNKDFGFYSRNSAQRVRLDTAGIREAVLMTETAEERVRALRSERIVRLRRGETPVPFGEGPFLAFHALPLLQHREPWQRLLDMDKTDRLFGLAPSTYARSLDRRLNLDGYVSFTAISDPTRMAYVQAFRDGGIEAAYRIAPDPRHQSFHAINFERDTTGVLARCTNIWKQIGVEPPIAASLTLSGVQGCGLVRSPDPSWGSQGTFDRDVVEVPEVLLYDLAAPSDVLLKPLLDHMWNAAGWEASPHYGPDGRWHDTP